MNPANVRLVASALVGAALGAVVALRGPWQVAVLTGWITGAAAFLVQVWVQVFSCDATRTREIATDEDVSHVLSDATLLTAAGASLVAVGFVLLKASQYHGASRGGVAALGAVGVALAWCTVQTLFTLRYARIFYETGDGVDFGGDAPDYHDFAYLAFTIGMTYQVSDTAITRRPLRRTVLRHALVSFVFATAFIAVLVNVVGGLL
ncbi:MAG TPA: DUF1345 domain-containing protein [Acidimicrobiales bacterium]|nr:DUF1345 domain-containing protein [Acidimicrobiales bacterium]